MGVARDQKGMDERMDFAEKCKRSRTQAGYKGSVKRCRAVSAVIVVFLYS
jgi:hypothetical protein